MRGIRASERASEGRSDPEAAVVGGYCAAVRSAITDDGRAPLAAPGLKLKKRLEKITDSLDRVTRAGGLGQATKKISCGWTAAALVS